jgi:hypothetical protein
MLKVDDKMGLQHEIITWHDKIRVITLDVSWVDNMGC